MKVTSDDGAPFRAKMFIPCLINQCYVLTPEGTERRSRMRLRIQRPDGTYLQRPFNEGPYYQCERAGCYYYDNPRGVHELNSEWVSDSHKIKPKRSNEQELARDSEVLL